MIAFTRSMLEELSPVVVDTVSLGEGQVITVFIVNDEHASQAIVGLRACFVMGVRVIPGCRGLLSNWQVK